MTPCPIAFQRNRSPVFTIAFIWLLFLAGCQSTSHAVTYYGLSSLAAPDRQTDPAAKDSDLSIGIGLVVLPDYLDRPQLVTRKGPNQVSIDEFNRWAGPLKSEIERVLTEDLIQATGSQRVAHLPWQQGFVPEKTIGITIYAFERMASGEVRLTATVIVSDKKNPKASQTWIFDRQVAPKNSSYTEMVAAQSLLLAELSRQIADILK